MRAADGLRIIDARLRESRFSLKLRRPRASNLNHVAFRTEVQTTRRAGLDTCGFKSLTHAIRAERAFENFLRLGIELRNVEGTAGNTITTPYAVVLLEINDAVLILDDRSIRGTGAQAARICAVHALVLAHQPHQVPIAFLLGELDEIVVVPFGRGHRLVGVVE